jgi:hypothetical protein
LEIAPELDPSVGPIGGSGPRAFAIRVDITHQLMPKRPSQPAPRFVTIAIRPSVQARDGTNHTPDFASDKAKYFCSQGLTAISENQPSGKSAWRKR